MAKPEALNVRMGADSENAPTTSGDEVDVTASFPISTLATIAAHDQEVPFPLTTRADATSNEPYARLFPKSADELKRMLAASESTPLSECTPMEDATRLVRERMVR